MLAAPLLVDDLLRQKGMCLGQGVFGAVFALRDRPGTVIKIMPADDGDYDGGVEIDVWRHLCGNVQGARLHPNLVHVAQWIYEPRKAAILVMDRCQVTLQALLTTGAARVHAASLVCQLFSGLAFCHERQVFHGDIKPPNILLDGDLRTNPRLRLTDFSNAVVLPLHAALPATSRMASPPYCAPEVEFGCLDHKAHGHTRLSAAHSADTWAAGLVAHDLYAQAGADPLIPTFKSVCRIARLCAVFGTPTADRWPDVAAVLPLLPPHAAPAGIPRDVAPDAPAPMRRVIAAALTLCPHDRPSASRLDAEAALAAAMAPRTHKRPSTPTSSPRKRPSTSLLDADAVLDAVYT